MRVPFSGSARRAAGKDFQASGLSEAARTRGKRADGELGDLPIGGEAFAGVAGESGVPARLCPGDSVVPARSRATEENRTVLRLGQGGGAEDGAGAVSVRGCAALVELDFIMKETQAIKPTILILCTGNSCRSHLAEGLLRAMAGDLFDVQSAGSKPAGYVYPMAIRAMAEVGIDLAGHRSKPMGEFLVQPVETVITVCGNADHACPIYPGQVNRHHWPFDDPAHAVGTEAEKMEVFRRVRNDITRTFSAYADGRRDALKAARAVGGGGGK